MSTPSDADSVDLRYGMSDLRREMHADIAEVKQELHSAAADIQTEFAMVRAEISEVREEVARRLLVRDSGNGKVIIADGYHRLCAVYAHDEDAVIPCKIV